jgi:hypothetical protein
MSSGSRGSRGSRSQHRLVRPWRSRWRRAKCRKGFRQREGCGQGHFSRSFSTCSSRSVGDWRRPKWTGRVYLESIVSSRHRWKYRVALDSIAGRYSAQLMHAFDSEQVLGKQGCRPLSSCCSERTTWPSGSELSPPKASMDTNNETASYRTDPGCRFRRARHGREFFQPLCRDDGPLRRSNYTSP